MQVINERDALAQESRDRETRILSLNNDLENLRCQLEESERVKRMLQMELDESVSFTQKEGMETKSKELHHF